MLGEGGMPYAVVLQFPCWHCKSVTHVLGNVSW